MDESLAVFVIVIVGLALAVGAFMLHNHSIPNIGQHLTAEVNTSKVVVFEQAMSPAEGTVWTVAQTPSGLMFKETGSQLVERLNLSNIDLSVGDVVAPHLYDWWFNGVDGYIYVANSPSLQFVNYTVMASLWKPLGDVAYSIIRSFGAGDTVYLAYYLNNARAGIHDSGGWYEVVIKPINQGEWAWTAFEYVANNPEGYRTYFNGTLVATYNVSGRGNLAGTRAPIRIGCDYDQPPTAFYKQVESYVIVYSDQVNGYKILSDNEITGIYNHIVPSAGLALFLDPTAYNGTTYIDLSGNGNDGIPYGGVARIPAEHPFLWLVKGLASDNKLHLKYVPPGSVFRIKYGGMVYEWRIDGTPNAAGLIEDYPIDIESVFGTQTLSNATIELIYPSQRVRFYVPPGFQVVVEDKNTGTSVIADAPNGVVTLAAGNIVKLVAPNGEGKLYIHVSETPAVYRFVVQTPDGRAADNAYIWIYDQDGNVVAYGQADQSGVYELKKTPQTPSIVRVKAVYLDNGVYYHAEQDFKLAEQLQPITQTPAPKPLLSGNMAKVAVSLGLAFVFALIAAVLIGARES